MSDQEDLDYYIMFPPFPPSPKDPALTTTTTGQDQREEFVFVYEEDKRPVVVLLGWAGCQDRYLAKYSAIYEEKRYSRCSPILFELVYATSRDPRWNTDESTWRMQLVQDAIPICTREVSVTVKR